MDSNDDQLELILVDHIDQHKYYIIYEKSFNLYYRTPMEGAQG